MQSTSDEQQQLIVVNLMRIEELTNSTRLRLWQPFHSGSSFKNSINNILSIILNKQIGDGYDTWAVDGVVIFSILAYEEAIQYQSEQDQTLSSSWLTSFGADETNHIFCSQ